MRAPAVSFASKFMLIAVVGLLTCGLVPSSFAFAAGADAPIPSLASSLMSGTSNVVREDVALAAPEADAVPEPVIGSFTVDGLTYAVTGESTVELVGVAPSVILSEGSEAAAPSVTLSEAAEGGVVEGSNESRASEAGLANLVLPETVTYSGIDYTLTSIAPYAFYLSGVTDVTLPASVNDVEERAFRSSDVASVAVAEGNPTYSSFDGALYDAECLSLLLIPEGKQGAVLLPKTAEAAEASVFSHCPLVDSISVEEDGAAFASENGLLYTSDLTTLLRVPAGATEITIREGCTTIAAGALEACASLMTINAPGTVTSISPDVFHAVPTVSLPAASAILSEGSEAEGSDESHASEAGDQITAMVALSSVDDNLPQVEPAAISLSLPGGADASPWRLAGFAVEEAQDDAELSEEATEAEPDLPVASLDSASTYAGAYDITVVNAEGSTLYKTNASGSTNTPIDSRVISCGAAEHQVHVRFLDKGGSLIVQLWHSKTTDDSYYRWVKPGYVLVGVKVTNGAGTLSDEIRATEVGTSYSGPSSIKGAGRTISPIFEKVTYTVRLNGNGATTMGTDSVQVEYGQAMPAITVPTRTGYAFSGYFWKADGGGTQYYNEKGAGIHIWDKFEEAPTSLSTAVTLGTLYAQWRVVHLSINAAGGKAVQIVPAAGGGWQMDYESAQEVWNDVLSGTRTCKVTGGGRIDYYDGSDSWVPVQLERSGYVFAGWQGLSVGEGQTHEFEAGQDVSLTATWRLEHMTINGAGAMIYLGADAQPGSSFSTDFWPASTRVVYGSGQVNFYDSSLNLQVVKLVRPGYAFAGWKELTLESGEERRFDSGDLTLTATWRLERLTVDGGGATIYVGESAQAGSSFSSDLWPESYRVIYGRGQVNFYDSSLNLHVITFKHPGYVFAGWKEKHLGVSEEERLTAGDLTLTATWRKATIAIDGGGGTVYKYVQTSGGSWTLDRDNGKAKWEDERSPSGTVKVYDYGRVEYYSDTKGWHALLVERTGYVFAGWKEVSLPDGGTKEFAPGEDVTLTATWRKATIAIDGGGGTVYKYVQTSGGSWTLDRDNGKAKWEDERSPSGTVKVYDYGRVEYYSDTKGWHALLVERAGYAFMGWSRSAGGAIDEDLVKTYQPSEIGDFKIYAKWAPAIRADAPISATVRLDVLGVEDQVMDEEAPGYLESRCGEPLKVAEVFFESKPGAAELFGAYVPDIELQALPGKDASWATDAPAFSFALDVAGDAAIEDDASKLAPLSMSGYEVRIPIAYRFFIPDALLDEVLGAIDPATFEDKKTPVCSVVYTVALQNSKSER